MMLGEIGGRLQSSTSRIGCRSNSYLEGRELAELTESDFPVYENGFSQATRNSSQDAINAAPAVLPNFFVVQLTWHTQI